MGLVTRNVAHEAQHGMLSLGPPASDVVLLFERGDVEGTLLGFPLGPGDIDIHKLLVFGRALAVGSSGKSHKGIRVRRGIGGPHRETQRVDVCDKRGRRDREARENHERRHRHAKVTPAARYMRFLALRIAAAAPAKRIRAIAGHDPSASARGVLRRIGNASTVVPRSFGTAVSDVARSVRRAILHARGFTKRIRSASGRYVSHGTRRCIGPASRRSRPRWPQSSRQTPSRCSCRTPRRSSPSHPCAAWCS